MQRSIKTLLSAAIVLCGALTFAVADQVVYFTNGKAIMVKKVEQQGDITILEIDGGGRLGVPTSQIERIEQYSVSSSGGPRIGAQSNAPTTTPRATPPAQSRPVASNPTPSTVTPAAPAGTVAAPPPGGIVVRGAGAGAIAVEGNRSMAAANAMTNVTPPQATQSVTQPLRSANAGMAGQVYPAGRQNRSSQLPRGGGRNAGFAGRNRGRAMPPRGSALIVGQSPPRQPGAERPPPVANQAAVAAKEAELVNRVKRSKLKPGKAPAKAEPGPESSDQSTSGEN